MNGFIGHKDVYNHLVAQFLSDHLTHALMFRGEEGIGKQLVARALARQVLCQNQAEEALFDAGNMPDFLVIDEPGGIKVADIAKLQQFLSEKPMYSERKVILLNDADNMNIQAQNKFLKTLEEPPAFALIILIVSKVTKLLDTIRSRVSEVSFEPLGSEDIMRALPKELSPAEKRLAARFSGGSLSKALALTADDSRRTLFLLPKEITEAIIADDIDKMAKFSQTLLQEKEKYQLLPDLLMLWLRDACILREDPDSTEISYEAERETLSRHSNYASAETIPCILDLLQEAREQLEYHLSPEIVMLELFTSISDTIH